MKLIFSLALLSALGGPIASSSPTSPTVTSPTVKDSCMFDGDNGVTGQLLPPPYEGQNHSEYISSLRLFRESCLRASGYTESQGDDLYSRPELKWTQDAYMQPQSHMYDRFLFDPVEQKFTPERFLEDLNERYGGEGKVEGGDLKKTTN